MKAGAALAALLLGGCGTEHGPTAADGGYAAACAARAMPAEPSASPRQHLRATGTAEFGAPGQAVIQTAELWQAGATRLRYRLVAESGKDLLFLFDGARRSWYRQFGGAWQEYSSPEVEREMRLRWELLRFPWGWRAELGAAAGAATLTRRVDEGEMVIEIGADGLLLGGAYAGIEVRLEDWRPAADAPWLLPHAWTWNGPSGRRVERFAAMHARTLFFAESFQPEGASKLLDGGRVLAGDLAAGAPILVRATLWTVDRAAPEGGPPGARWWRRGAERVAAVLLAPEAPPPLRADGAAATADATPQWLLWAPADGAVPAAEALAELEAAARGAGWRPAGAPLVAEPAAAPLQVLMPLAAPE